MSLTVIILTWNEARHIVRALASVALIADRTIIVDSGSTDETVILAKEAGAEVLVHTFVNQAQQFNWALSQLNSDTDWILRLDADEIVTELLVDEIRGKLDGFGTHIKGVYISRRLNFLGRSIEWGGVYPIRILRLFRFGYGYYENRWMDEHICVEGETENFSGEIIDENLNSLSWWTVKHNNYASREVVDLLNLEYGFMPHDTVASLTDGQQAGMKRWLKEKVYSQLPGGFRALAYFLFRYIVRLGFLDGKEGTAFHVLQGFWYRYLVDTKLLEVKAYMRNQDLDVVTAIKDVLEIDVQEVHPETRAD